MKNICCFFITCGAAALLFSCNNQNTSTGGETLTAKPGAVNDSSTFSKVVDGKKVALFTLKNTKGTKAAVTNYGARLVNLFVPDKNANPVDIVAGFDNIDSFMYSKELYYGAVIGRYANRIANGVFKIDNVEYKLPRNNGPNSLHGGPGGFHAVIWDAKQLNDSTLELSYLSKDGEEGYPGNLNVKVSYQLGDSGLRITYDAISDKKTVCNLTNHAFFNLNGAGSGTINKHLLMINADKYTPVDSLLIPFGKAAPVAGTPFDFRKAAAIDSRINEKNEQLLFGKGYDHNFIINGKPGEMRLAATATGDKTGIVMEVYTVEPGLQFYGGNFMKGNTVLKGNARDDFRTAFCLETQHYPDSPNRPDFPSVILNAGDHYFTQSFYTFKVK
jgi:aldose 1-epimerase